MQQHCNRTLRKSRQEPRAAVVKGVYISVLRTLGRFRGCTRERHYIPFVHVHRGSKRSQAASAWCSERRKESIIYLSGLAVIECARIRGQMEHAQLSRQFLSRAPDPGGVVWQHLQSVPEKEKKNRKKSCDRPNLLSVNQPVFFFRCVETWTRRKDAKCGALRCNKTRQL